MDLSSAFDTLDHTTLINTLEMSFGLRGNVINLYGRHFTVRIEQPESGECYITFGVPQRSNFGPAFVHYVHKGPGIDSKQVQLLISQLCR